MLQHTLGLGACCLAAHGVVLLAEVCYTAVTAWFARPNLDPDLLKADLTLSSAVNSYYSQNKLHHEC